MFFMIPTSVTTKSYVYYQVELLWPSLNCYHFFLLLFLVGTLMYSNVLNSYTPMYSMYSNVLYLLIVLQWALYTSMYSMYSNLLNVLLCALFTLISSIYSNVLYLLRCTLSNPMHCMYSNQSINSMCFIYFNVLYLGNLNFRVLL